MAEREPIPAGIYYGIDGDNFYSIAEHHGQGNEFYRLWQSRIDEFPKRIGFGAILSPEQHTIRRELMALIRRARDVGVVIEVRLIPERPLAMGNYRMDFDVRPAREPSRG